MSASWMPRFLGFFTESIPEDLVSISMMRKNYTIRKFHVLKNKCTSARTDVMPDVQPKVRAVHCGEVGITYTWDWCRLWLLCIQSDHLPDSTKSPTFPAKSRRNRCKQMAPKIMLNYTNATFCSMKPLCAAWKATLLWRHTWMLTVTSNDQ